MTLLPQKLRLRRFFISQVQCICTGNSVLYLLLLHIEKKPRSMIMILEDLGVKQETFLDLWSEAVKEAHNACDDISELVRVLNKHRLGLHFGFLSILQRLSSPPFNLHLDLSSPERCLRSPFLDDLIRCAVGTILREVQYRCRIPVPQSWHLVGVADEGPAYVQRGLHKEKDVFMLKEGEVYGQLF